MAGLTYPFVYECTNCSTETTITRTEAPDLHPNPDGLIAHVLVLRARGWLKDEIEGLLWCPDCIPGKPDEGHDEGQGDHEDTSQINAFSRR